MKASEILNAMLRGETNIWDIMFDHFEHLHTNMSESSAEERLVLSAISAVADNAKDIKQYAERMKHDIDAAADYVSGKPAAFNTLGVLQGSAPRFDGLCMLFAQNYRHAQSVMDVYLKPGYEPDPRD